MLYDRPYMRFPGFSQGYSLVERLIFILIALFVLQSVIMLIDTSNGVIRYFSLSGNGLTSGFVWGLFTYAFLHDGPFHLIFNLLGLFFIGRIVERDMSKAGFIYFSATAALTGGIFWLVFNYNSGILIGTSAVVTACLCYFCLNRPNDPVSFLLFFVLPVSLKPKIILFAIVGIELYGFIFTELQQSGAIAHSAHLGGLMVGLITFSLKKKNFGIPTFKFNFPEIKQSPNKFYKTNQKNHSKKDYKVDISDYNAMQNEVDRILDKINSKGFGSLTPREKDCLEKAKTFLNKNP